MILPLTTRLVLNTFDVFFNFSIRFLYNSIINYSCPLITLSLFVRDSIITSFIVLVYNERSTIFLPINITCLSFFTPICLTNNNQNKRQLTTKFSTFWKFQDDRLNRFTDIETDGQTQSGRQISSRIMYPRVCGFWCCQIKTVTVFVGGADVYGMGILLILSIYIKVNECVYVCVYALYMEGEIGMDNFGPRR